MFPIDLDGKYWHDGKQIVCFRWPILDNIWLEAAIHTKLEHALTRKWPGNGDPLVEEGIINSIQHAELFHRGIGWYFSEIFSCLGLAQMIT